MRVPYSRTAVRSALVASLLPVAAHAQTVLYVDAAGTGGAGNGSSWTNAYLDLQDALENAAAGGIVTQIRVAQGVYRPDRATGDAGLSFRMLSGVVLRGGFAGAGEADPDLWDPNVYATVLSGDLAGDDGAAGMAENAWHVVDASGVDDSAVLDGFVIRGGNADGAAPHYSGGGMRNLSGRPTVVRCAFEDNAAAQHGGAVYNAARNAVPRFVDCSFENNSAGGRGGALYNDIAGSAAERMTFSSCVFRDNTASNGGAVYGHGGGLEMLDCAFEQNTASADGGAVYNSTNTSVFEDCSFTANSALDGGAMRNASSRPALARCLFSGNTASDDGGAMLNQNAGPSLADCAYVGNSAGDEGGALWSFNTSSYAVRNCTFSDNLAGDKGGALYNWGTAGGGSHPQLTSCVLWDNRDAGGPDESGQMHTDHGSPTLNFSCLQGLTGVLGGAGNIAADPLLESDGWHLPGPSPCVDGGDPAYAAPSGDTDLDGEPRAARGRVDMGADELPPDADHDGVADLADNCPADPNSGQEDADGDGAGDACDGCPNDPADDADADGVCGDTDNCPSAANAEQADADADGAGDACDADDDNDGLSDDEEAALGTDPFAADTDGDGRSDRDEVDAAQGGGCPDPALADSDGDTLSDGDEQADGTDPCNADTDGDGLPDDQDTALNQGNLSPAALEVLARELATVTIPNLDLRLFNGRNRNVKRERRGELADGAAAAARSIASGRYRKAIKKLEHVLRKIDGESPARDWMIDSPEKTALAGEFRNLIEQLQGLTDRPRRQDDGRPPRHDGGRPPRHDDDRADDD